MENLVETYVNRIEDAIKIAEEAKLMYEKKLLE
jgi:hypothetical protein